MYLFLEGDLLIAGLKKIHQSKSSQDKEITEQAKGFLSELRPLSVEEGYKDPNIYFVAY